MNLTYFWLICTYPAISVLSTDYSIGPVLATAPVLATTWFCFSWPHPCPGQNVLLQSYTHYICCYFHSRNQANPFKIEWTRGGINRRRSLNFAVRSLKQPRIECRTANLLFKFMKILLEVLSITGNQSVNFYFCIFEYIF